jgi:hypothetical protein
LGTDTARLEKRDVTVAGIIVIVLAISHSSLSLFLLPFVAYPPSSFHAVNGLATESPP